MQHITEIYIFFQAELKMTYSICEISNVCEFQIQHVMCTYTVCARTYKHQPAPFLSLSHTHTIGLSLLPFQFFILSATNPLRCDSKGLNSSLFQISWPVWQSPEPSTHSITSKKKWRGKKDNKVIGMKSKGWKKMGTKGWDSHIWWRRGGTKSVHPFQMEGLKELAYLRMKSC